MKCPYCNHPNTKVLDSRPINEGISIRRRRECEKCNRRFTTFETIEVPPLLVIKKDGSREEFSREKVLKGLLKACEKRPIPLEVLENLVEEVERELRSDLALEVLSQKVGELVMERLVKLDEIAYVRFASVYRQFKDISVFLEELNQLLKRN